jgi:acetyl esterase
MPKLLTREQNIKKAKQLRNLQKLSFKLQSLFRNPLRNSPQKEIFVDTEFGRVRTLWYGFEIAEKAPVFFDLHGGGFVLGTADMDESMNIAFHRQVGCKVISIEYAKAPEFPYPVAVNQVYAVVKHVFENAEKYSVETKKMAIGGHSAGGNLSAVTCMKARKDGKFQLVCQIMDYPPLDLATSPLEKPQPKGAIPPEMAMMFDACYIDPTQARDPYVSPIYAVEEDLEELPPALFILAGRDSLHDEGLKYFEMLRAAKVVAEVHEYPNAAHGFTYYSSAESTDAFEKMVVFLRKYFK